MEQHAIPQQISSYQFRLVGDMTLKQFFQLAGGLLVSLLFYASNLHPIIKWPAIIFFALLGVALAFLPLEERPLEKWIIAFFKSVYTPTIFNWKKTEVAPIFYQEEAVAPTGGIIAPNGEKALNAYLSGVGSLVSGEAKKLEDNEKSFLAKLTGFFNPQPQAQPVSAVPAVVATPPQPVSPTTTPAEAPAPTTQINIPQTEAVRVVGPNAPSLVMEEKDQDGVTQEIRVSSVAPVAPAAGTITTNQAQFSPSAAPPAPPSIINTVTGQVVDSLGKIVPNAIMEIRDVAGRPVRALKTNRLGHFITVTPLVNGRYEIVVEKEGFTFEPVSFDAAGDIIPPIAIQAKEAAV